MSITISTTYIVYNHDGTGVRHHHFTDKNIVHQFKKETATENEPGTRQASAPDKYPFGNDSDPDLFFAFMSVTDTKDGNFLYTTAGDYLYMVGTHDINILAVYAPTPGSGGKPAIWVDAFNMNTGSFSDDVNFISVLAPPQNTIDTAKTFEANQEGDISLDTPEHIVASATIDNGVPFIEWKQIMPTQSIVNKNDFDVDQNDSGKIWIAFYQSPNQPVYNNITSKLLLWQWVSYATMVDGNPGNPGILLASEVREFAIGVALAKTAGDVDKSLSRELLNIAGKQIDIANQAIQKKIGQSNER